MEDIVTAAYKDFMSRAFGRVPQHPEDYEIEREVYKSHMAAIQEIYGLYQGHPAYLPFMLTMVGRSPRIIDPPKTEGGKDDA